MGKQEKKIEVKQQVLEKYADLIQTTMPVPFATGAVQAYLIKGDRLALIDAGINTPEACLKNAGRRFPDIEQKMLAHYPGHTGLPAARPMTVFNSCTALFPEQQAIRVSRREKETVDYEAAS